MTASVAFAGVPVPARVTEIRAKLAPSVTTSEAASFETLLTDAQQLATGAVSTAPTTSAAMAYGALPRSTSSYQSGARSIALSSYARWSGDAGAEGSDVVSNALQYVGVPYVWGGNDPATGLDCSGFTKLVFGSLGVSLPRVSTDQAMVGTPVASLTDARPGDLLAFGSPVDHVAIYLGDGRIVHAAGTGKGVRVDDVYRQPTAIRRIVAADASGSTAGAPAYDALFDAAGARHGVEPALLSAVARAESGYDPDAVSSAGALGLMQFMPATAAGLGIDPLDPAQAIDGAARYLSQQLSTFGSVELALAAYNAGPAAVRTHGGVPPYTETKAYVSKVLAYFDQARATIGVPA